MQTQASLRQGQICVRPMRLRPCRPASRPRRAVLHRRLGALVRSPVSAAVLFACRRSFPGAAAWALAAHAPAARAAASEQQAAQ